MLVVRDNVGGISSESTVNKFIVIMIRFYQTKLGVNSSYQTLYGVLRCSFKVSSILVPFPFVPEAIHFFIYLAGVVLADKIAQLLHLFFGFEVRQQTKKIHLCLI